MTDAKGPEFIESLLHSEECGRSLLYDVYENEVCTIAEIVNHIDTLTRERDDARRDAKRLRTDNAVLSEEIHMQLIELGMKRIGDHMSQYFRADDECGDAAAACLSYLRQSEDMVDALTAERDAQRKDAALVQKYRLEGCVLVPVSRELLSEDWSKQPLCIRLNDNGDGTHTMILREHDAALAVQP